jgi:hypothetical protein
VPAPSPLGALMLKAAAYRADSRDRDRHAYDAAFLVSLITDSLEVPCLVQGQRPQASPGAGRGHGRSRPRCLACSWRSGRGCLRALAVAAQLSPTARARPRDRESQEPASTPTLLHSAVWQRRNAVSQGCGRRSGQCGTPGAEPTSRAGESEHASNLSGQDGCLRSHRHQVLPACRQRGCTPKTKLMQELPVQMHNLDGHRCSDSPLSFRCSE